MDSYRIFETENFQDNLKQIRKTGSKGIEKKLRSYVYSQLREKPQFGSNIKKLRDFTPETWRYRIGDWRFFYEIDENEHIVYMIAAHHRKEAY